MKRLECLPLSNELKAQTDIAKKKYQGLYKAFISNKDNKNGNESLTENEKPSVKKFNKSNLNFNGLTFCSQSDNKKFDSLSFESKYSYLLIFYDDLQKLIKMR